MLEAIQQIGSMCRNKQSHYLIYSYKHLDPWHIQISILSPPFKEVIAQLQRQLMASQELKELFKQKFIDTALHSWIRQSVGTVHTFQGKQAAVVFFVLGADKSTLPAIEWASRKPNLLNVAVTRGQSRFYIIGDYALWKNWPHFEIAAKKLKAVMYSKTSR